MSDSKIRSQNFGNVGVFLGGSSHERPISIRSGKAVYQALRNAGLHVVAIDTANGFLKKMKGSKLDLAFLALHGTGGEDGEIQKVLSRAKIPFTGSGSKASALAFDKSRAKRLFQRFKIPTPTYEVLTRTNWKYKIEKWVPPYVIKPVSEGSSIGVFFIEGKEDGYEKIEASFRKYKQLLVERKIDGREFTVGILGESVLPVIELKPKRDFYDYKAKYTKGLTEYLIPAPISRKLKNQLQSIALRAHRLLGLRDLSRVDFKVDHEGQPFVLEINSIPGFTETSLLPKAARHTGIDFTQLCLNLLQMANARRLKKA